MNRRIRTRTRTRWGRYVLAALLFFVAAALWNKHYVAPRDEMIWCGLNHVGGQVLACQDEVYSRWPLGQYLSGGVSPSDAARGPSIRAERVSAP